MSATAAPARSDRSDFRTVTTSGAALGVVTAVAVVLFLAASRQLPGGSALQSGAEALIVLAAGVATSFLPAAWSRARQVEGIAGAAAIGLVGTIVFSAIDIVLFRPLKAYPWTWDAIGGGSTWWYLPVWWMLGTFLAWMGAIVTARQADRGETTLARRAAWPIVAALVVATATRVAGLGVALPVATGGGFTIGLAVAAVVALARKG
ncbi:MAG TPA: hypothetical protein VH116_03985 [Gemmatimonadales bacterium]|jgi:hypothetical protein|nr:hypothetical protein [Gemmatimonadales bacterium]